MDSFVRIHRSELQIYFLTIKLNFMGNFSILIFLYDNFHAVQNGLIPFVYVMLLFIMVMGTRIFYTYNIDICYLYGFSVLQI